MKLGYGGTKEEMQRLLEDAEKLSGKKFDISSYGDIVDAIHVVQTEIGITGTTAKEAASTISGSIASMKSAWTNLITGIADENADLDVLIENFVDSVVTAGENVIPRVEQILSGIGTAVTKLAPFISEAVPELVTNALPALLDAGVQLIGGLLQGLITALPALAGSAVSIVDTLATTIVEQLPALLEAAVEVIVTLANGIAESLPELIPTIVDVVLQIVDTLIDNVDMLVDASIAIIIALADGLINSMPKLLLKIPELVIKIVDAIIENAPKLLNAAVEIIAELTLGLIEGFVGIASKVGGWLYDNIAKPIIDKVSDFKDAGKQLLEGLWNGISDKVAWLKGKVSGVVDTIKGWFTGKDGFDEHSPSKWSKQVFRYVMEGGGEGLEDGLPDLMKDVRIVTNKVKGGLDFGTATVDFASSGLGASSVNIINSASSANEANTVGGPVTINLMFPDGTQFASYLLPNLINVAKASGTPIVNPA